MGHVVHKDTTLSTVFLGFQIPKAGKSLGYFECMKSVVANILPWEVCMPLITSLVTDGERLNSGSKQGLWARFIKEVRQSNTCHQPVIALWCVPHQFNLGWKDTCKVCPLISGLITDASRLSSYFHESGERTRKLKATAAQKKLPTPLRFVTYYEVRWLEYVFDLLTVTLRNWRAAMQYFKCEKEVGLANRWLLYDRTHFLAFITDVLKLLKKFQKTFQSDTISLLTVDGEINKLMDELKNLKSSPLDKGWEQLFLADVEVKNDGEDLYGHRLLKNSRRTQSDCVFDIVQRKQIIDKLVLHLNIRLDYDSKLRDDLKALLAIRSTVTDQCLKLCYTSIANDLDEEAFNDSIKNICLLRIFLKITNLRIPTLQTLHKLNPNQLLTLNTALARVVAAKPHSVDVERLVSSYNKVQTPDRSASSELTLFNHLYVKVNMTHVNNFDPSVAVQHWLNQKIGNHTTVPRVKSRNGLRVSSRKQTNISHTKVVLKFHFNEFKLYIFDY